MALMVDYVLILAVALGGALALFFGLRAVKLI